MIPLWVRLQIVEQEKTRINIRFPLFLAWILFLWLSYVFWNVLSIVLFIAVIIVFLSGKASIVFKYLLAMLEILLAMSGTSVHIDNSKTRINIQIL